MRAAWRPFARAREAQAGEARMVDVLFPLSLCGKFLVGQMRHVRVDACVLMRVRVCGELAACVV